MLQLREGIWRWEARHPSWSEDDGGPDGWGPEVASYAVETRERLLLVDPLSVPAEAEELAAGRETAIVLTCPWHQRDARALGERLGAPIFVPPPDEGEQDPVPGTVFAAGDRLPGGVKALPGLEPNDLVLWIEDLRALVLGDTLVDRGRGARDPAHVVARRDARRGAGDAPATARPARRARAADARPARRPGGARARDLLTSQPGGPSDASGRSHTLAWVGCTVPATTASSSRRSASRSICSRMRSLKLSTAARAS